MRKTILIVDDEKDMNAMLKRYFELNGYFVQTAQNGLQAIEKAGNSQILSYWTSICRILTALKCVGAFGILWLAQSFF